MGNDGFEGGPTRFYTENQRHYQPAQPENQIYELRPEKGSCIVFNHNITHDGGELESETKYILRTEVMYKHLSELGGQVADDSDSDFETEGQPIIDVLL